MLMSECYLLPLTSTLTPGEGSLEPTLSLEDITLMGVISGTVTGCPSQSSNYNPKQLQILQRIRVTLYVANRSLQ